MDKSTRFFFNKVSTVSSNFKYQAENYPTAQYEQEFK